MFRNSENQISPETSNSVKFGWKSTRFLLKLMTYSVLVRHSCQVHVQACTICFENINKFISWSVIIIVRAFTRGNKGQL